MNFFALDVETSNSDRGSICQIGWVEFKDGQIIDEFESLINPKAPFLQRNTIVHGITENDVKGSPTFEEIYPTICQRLTSSAIAHHSSFDWQAFAHACYLCEVDVPDVIWLDTRLLSQDIWPDLDNYQLPTVCAHLGIELINHHDALSDARACGRILLESGREMDELVSVALTVTQADVEHYSHRFPRNGLSTAPDAYGKKLLLLIEKGLGELSGLLEGIIADDVVADLEVKELDIWVSKNSEWMIQAPWEEVNSAIDDLIDAVEDDRDELMRDLVWLVNNLKNDYFKGEAIELMKLEGMFRGFLSDGSLDDKEVYQLQLWLEANRALSGHFLFDEIYKLVEDVLEDGIITSEERDSLTSFMYEFTSNLNESARMQIQENQTNSEESSSGVYSKPLISFQDCLFCLSGDFLNFDTKSDVESVIESRGGAISKGVTKKISYLVVGGQGSEDWKFGKYGRKVEKAMQYKSKGVAIEVVQESWFFELLS